MLETYALESRIGKIASWGFDGFDCRYGSLEDVRFTREIERAPIPLATVYSQIRSPSILDRSDQLRAEAISTIVQRARKAAEYGADNLIVVPVFGPPRIGPEAGSGDILAIETSLLLAALNDLAVRLKDVPITLVIEPVNRTETHFLTVPTKAAELCQQVNNPRIATMVDTYHCYMDGLDFKDHVGNVGNHLALVHLSDSDRGFPGEGQVDFSSVIHALRSIDAFSGWLGFECRPIQSSEDERRLAQSVTELRALDHSRADGHVGTNC